MGFPGSDRTYNQLFLFADFRWTGDMNGLGAFKIKTSVVHAGADCHGGGGELLNLFHFNPVLEQPGLQSQRILHCGARMPDDDVWDDLAFDSSFVDLRKVFLEKSFIGFYGGLPHQSQNCIGTVLGS